MWRKRALISLKEEALEGIARGDPASARLRRFTPHTPRTEWLRLCVQQCREPLGHPLPDDFIEPLAYSSKLRGLVDANSAFSTTPTDQAIISSVLAKVCV